MTVEVSAFGKTPDGQPVALITIENKHGNRVQLTDFGAILVSLEVPDLHGRRDNVNLGFPSLDGYLERHPYFGSTVGRFCNRIAKGQFQLDGKPFSLAVNNGPNHLHGGSVGFDRKLWATELLSDGVRFQTVSPDGEEGYPGRLEVSATYRWDNDNALTTTFEAETDAATVLNLTNHAYWNLAGAKSGSVADHQLQLDCQRYLEVDDTLIPTGRIVEAAGTALDFRQFRRLGERLDQLPVTKGYDHCYVVDGPAGQAPRRCAIAKDPRSGRQMEVLTTQPGMQLYTGNHLDGEFPPYSGFCLETQHYPDSPNQPEFPSTRLDPGERFFETTIHRFSVVAV